MCNVSSASIRQVMAVLGLGAILAVPAFAAADYHPITPDAEGGTVTLTGHDLSIEDVVRVARHGAKVRYSPEAIQRAADGDDLRAEAGAENIPVYGLNRGAGALREVQMKRDEFVQLSNARRGAKEGVLPEIADEDLVRAFLVIRANSVPFEASGPEFMHLLVDLLNKRVTPVMYSRGTLGEGDLFLTSNFLATMVGRGDAYYQGVRMSAAEALKKAGLKALSSRIGGGTSNAYADALAVLLVADGREALEWADLIHGMDKLGMNSSVTPMASLVQEKRPFKWVAWDAARIMDILKGSYLFEKDPTRILQDPESMRASYIRQGSAWQAWAALRDNVLVQINSGEQNPVVLLDASPSDSWELSTPQFMQYYVKGGPLSHGRHGYVMSAANWDPYPMSNAIEAFTTAVANMDAAIAQRIERFSDRGPTPFFTGIYPKDVLTPEQLALSPALTEPYFAFMDVWAEIQNDANSVTPEGNAADIGVADIEASSRLKAVRGRQVVDLTVQLLSYDLLTATYWLDVRKAQDPSRSFAPAPSAAWSAFRKVLPWQQEVDSRPDLPYGVVAYRFLKETPASRFYAAGPAMPSTDSQLMTVHARPK
ncbi:MAG TPA: aromatic amino acid ammonia-lyase [Steroidobacteraceae bacterium]|nr:aromatic amino acid ammonia-lyase [Steroidobacteraceae bacterium]